MFSRSLAFMLLVGVLEASIPASPVEGRGAGDGRAPVATLPAPARASEALSDVTVQRIVRELGGMRPTGGRALEPGELELSLEESIQLTLQKNPNIQIAQLTRDALKPAVARAGVLFHPVAGGTMTGTRTEVPQVGFKKDDELVDGQRVADAEARKPTAFISQAVPTGATLVVSGDMRRNDTVGSEMGDLDTNYSVSVVQPLLRGGRIYVATRALRDAEYGLRMEEARLRAEILGVTARTKAAYYNVLLAERLVDLTGKAVAQHAALVDGSRALCRPDAVPDDDVRRARVVRVDDEARMATARGDLELAENALTECLGIRIGTPVALRDERIDFEPLSLDLERWLAMAIERRPEIVAAKQALEKSTLHVRVAENTVLPQLNLVAAYGKGETGTTLGNALNLQGEVWTTGLVFSVPIGSGAARTTLAQAKIEHDRVAQELAQTERGVELQVRATMIKLRTHLEKIQALAAELEEAKGELERTGTRYARGIGRSVDVIGAQDRLLAARAGVLKSVVEYNIGLAELEAVLGGPI
jgi:outer membrane protein TolC